MAQRQSMQGHFKGGRRLIMNSPPLVNHQAIVQKLANAQLNMEIDGPGSRNFAATQKRI
jgi:hypothetical protein